MRHRVHSHCLRRHLLIMPTYKSLFAYKCMEENSRTIDTELVVCGEYLSVFVGFCMRVSYIGRYCGCFPLCVFVIQEVCPVCIKC